jgi:hypothetical protein
MLKKRWTKFVLGVSGLAYGWPIPVDMGLNID